MLRVGASDRAVVGDYGEEERCDDCNIIDDGRQFFICLAT